MSDIIPIRKQNQKRTIDDEFDDILHRLDDVEKKKKQAIEQTIKAKLQKNYDYWVTYFRLLKNQFRKTWNLFGGIQGKTQDWFREDGKNYGQWNFMGASGFGYHFGAGIYHSDGRYLVVSFGCLSTEEIGNGIGDERDVGRKVDLDAKLIGLENCEGSLSYQLRGSEHMLEKLGWHNLQFAIRNNDGHGVNSVGIDFLYENKLKEVCQKLFVALNKDELIDLPKYLCAPNQE